MKKSKQFTVRSCLIALLAVISAGSLSANDNRWSFYFGAGAGQYEWDQDNDLSNTLSNEFLLGSFFTTPQQRNAFRQAQLLSFLENSQPTTYEFKETHARLGFEYLATENKHLGIRFGLSGQSGTVSCTSNCGELGLLGLNVLLEGLSSGSSSSLGSFIPILLIGSVDNQPESDVSYYTMDFGLDYHFSPDAGVDPYLGFNLGVGTCQLEDLTDGNCTIGKIGPRLGLRFNFAESWYFYTEAEYNRLHMQFAGDEGGNLTIEANAPVFLAGVAYRF